LADVGVLPRKEGGWASYKGAQNARAGRKH
jgi:hypothetical protein